jgi:pimeloyl-ACP methyl ester carboxylesterase
MFANSRSFFRSGALLVQNCLCVLFATMYGCLPNAQAQPTELEGVPIHSATQLVNGIQIHYITAGHGPVVVLLHGYPETWYAWRKIIPKLADRYTLVVPDMRGLGDSGRPADGDYRKKSVSEDIYQLVVKLGYKQVSLVGQDMGGPVAIAYAAYHPDAVKNVVFIESGVPGEGLEEAMDTAHGGSWHFGFFASPEIPEMLTLGREKEFFTAWAFQGAFVRHKEAFPQDVIDEYVRHYSSPGGMTAGFGYYRAFAQDAKDNAAIFSQTKLTMPVLAVGADHSFGEFTAKNARNVATHVESVMIGDCGHFVDEEQPEALAKVLLTFLGKP